MRTNTTKLLPLDEQNEDEQIMTQADDVLSHFFYGNYTDGVNLMIEYNIEPAELGKYLEEMAEEYCTTVSDMYNGHFTYSFMANIGMSYQQERK